MVQRQFSIAQSFLPDPYEAQMHEHAGLPLYEGEIEIVTQEQLNEYLYLKFQQARMKGRGRQIRNALQNGARVEPGMIGAAIRTVETQSVTQAKLRNLLGDEEAQQIINDIQPTMCHQLLVFEELSQI